MTIPQSVREEVRLRLWAEAERLQWPTLTASDKSRYYTIWTETKDLGGRLATFMDPRHVRVYIKDTLLKSYTRAALEDHLRPYRVLGLSDQTPVVARYIKPHGRMLADGRQIAWSRATEWKATVLALHERAFPNGRPFAAVLLEAGAKFAEPDLRRMVESAATKLGVERVVWLE